MECKGKRKEDDDKFQKITEVFKHEEGSILMTNEEKMHQGMCTLNMEMKYFNLMDCFCILILILLQVHGAMVEMPNMVKLLEFGKGYMLERICYCLLFLLIWLMGTILKRKRRRSRKKSKDVDLNKMYENMKNKSEKVDSNIDQHMKKERTVMKSFKGKEDTRCLHDKYLKGHLM